MERGRSGGMARCGRRVERTPSRAVTVRRMSRPGSRAEALLWELCVTYGYCIPIEEADAILAERPPDADAFLDAVLTAEGIDPALADKRTRANSVTSSAIGSPTRAAVAARSPACRTTRPRPREPLAFGGHSRTLAQAGVVSSGRVPGPGSCMSVALERQAGRVTRSRTPGRSVGT
jgi:hypothetical protein